MTSWPPAEGLTTKLVPRAKSILELSHSITIKASADTVFDTVLDTSNYPNWNTWVPAALLVGPTSGPDSAPAPTRMRPGTVLDFNVRMDASKPHKITTQRLKVTDVSTPSAPSSYLSTATMRDASFTADVNSVYRVCWVGAGGLAAWGLLRTERVHEVIVRGDDECEVRTWEIMGGVLAYVVKLAFQGTLSEKFKLWDEDLKAYCERRAEDEVGSNA